MPYFAVDHSANLEQEIDMSAFCDHLRKAAVKIDTFPAPGARRPAPGVRVRAIPAPHWSIADGNPRHGYIDISIGLRAGRPDDVKAAVTQAIFDAAHEFLAPVMATRPLALSLEMRDIDPALSPKAGTIRDHPET